MKISFAATRPAGDYALVIPSAGDNRPGLASIGDGGKAIEAALKRQRFEGDAAASVEHFLDGGQRLLVVGTGANSKPADAAEKLGGAIVSRLLLSGETHAVIDLTGLDYDADAAARVALAAALRAWRYDRYKTRLKDKQKPTLAQVTIVGGGDGAKAAWDGRYSAVYEGASLTRELVTEPANIIYPQSFVERVIASIDGSGLEVEVLDGPAMTKLGMGALLGVNQGSRREPRVLVLRWNGGTKGEAPVALLGKGVTFDTGGISIKPAANMHHMTSDMGGAAAVIATVVLAAEQQLPIDVIATVPMAENMPSSTAQRPGDVLTQYGGITVEVLNTDAEGRLILADAIVRACEDKPDYLIETSTLTGAQTVALGARTPGVMGSDEFRDRVAEISQEVGENAWPMPLPEELKDDLKSTVADLANVSGSRYAGMLVAGTYLREFVADGVQWAHIDIAGPAYNTGGPWGYTGKGGTGVPTRTMFAVLEDIAGNG